MSGEPGALAVTHADGETIDGEDGTGLTLVVDTVDGQTERYDWTEVGGSYPVGAGDGVTVSGASSDDGNASVDVDLDAGDEVTVVYQQGADSDTELLSRTLSTDPSSVAHEATPDCGNVTLADDDGDGAQEVETDHQLDCIRTDTDADYELVADVDASGTAAWNGGKGFEPIGGWGAGFNGTFDGQGHTIRGLTIDRPSGSCCTGLFGAVAASGTVENVRLADADVTATDYTGTLVGSNEGTVRSASASGSASGGQGVGGLVGMNYGGSVVDAEASTTVTSSASQSYAGGLVGLSYKGGSIENGRATGDVTGASLVGGLVGYGAATGDGTVLDSSATGDVAGTQETGGLVGFHGSGRIADSYATGSVSGTRAVGGLVGDVRGDVLDSYATGQVGGSGRFTGGLAGYVEAGAVERSYAAGAVTGDRDVGALAGAVLDGRSGTGCSNPYQCGEASLSQTFATGLVEASGTRGGLVGNAKWSTVSTTAAYWDTESTNQSTSALGTGLTTAEMQGSAATSNAVGFDFASTWGTVTDDYPVLQSADRGAQLNAR